MNINFNKIENANYPNELEQHYSSKHAKELGIDQNIIHYKHQKDYDLLSLEQFEKLKVQFNQDLSLPDDVQTPRDFEAYLFNSQTTVDLSDNKTTIFIDGVEIPIEYFHIDRDGKPNITKYELFPLPFADNDYIEWELKTKNSCKQIKLERVRYNSAHIKKYQSIDFPLKVNLFIDEKNIRINIATILENHDTHTTVQSLLEALDIQLAFFKKNLLINNVKVSTLYPNGVIGSQKVKKEIRERYNYWYKVQKLERILDLSLKLYFPLKSNDIVLLDKMLVSFIFDKSFREPYNITNIKLNFNNIKEAQDFANDLKEGSKALISWREPEKINVFNINLSLYKFYYISNFYVDSIKIKEEPTVTMTINVRELENDKMIVASKYILNSETEVTISHSQTPQYLVEFREQLLSK